MALAGALSFTSAVAHAEAATPMQIGIAAQPLAQALNDLARQTRLELMVQPALVAGKAAPAVSGQLTPQQALNRLLAGSGLAATIEGSAVVVKASSDTSAAGNLPLVTVTAGPQEETAGGTTGYVARRSAAGAKTDTPILETPQSISVVTKQQLEDQKPRSIPEALNYTPGAFTGLVGSSNRYDYVALRGFNDSSVDSTLLDGLRLLSDQGSYSSMQVDPYFLERIDVVRGPASVLYGRASPGGLVALTSAKPQFEPYREVQLTVGNRNRMEGAVDLTGPVDANGVMAYRLTALGRSLDSQFNHVKEQRQAIAPSLTIRPSKDTQLLLQAYLQHDPEGSYHSGVPADASINAKHNGSRISRYFFDGDPSVEKYQRTQRFLGYQFDHAFNDQWKFRQNFRYVSADTTLRQVYGYGWASANELTRYYAGARESTRGHTVDNQLEGRFETGAVKHTLLTGLDYQKRSVGGSWESGGASPINVFAPVYGLPGLSDVTSSPIDRRLEQTGLYIQDQMELGRWRLTLGGRQDWAQASNRYGTDAPAEWKGSRFTKRAGLVYLFDNGIAPYVGYSDGFNPSLRNDQQGNILRPAETRQVEVGIRYQPKGSNTLLSAAVYDLKQENVATRPVGATYYVPSGKVRSRGLELEARSQLTSNFSMLASYTFTDMKFIESAEGFTGNTPYQAPRHMASVWGDWTFMPGFTLGAGVRHVGTSWVDNANSFKVRPYAVVDLMLRIDLAYVNPSLKGSSLRLHANNVFDKSYVASCLSQQYCYWGDARNVAATLTYQW
ncbi:TonB-dependent siderophore receptor [Variovorax sp. J22G21]|uniref:TonB-dependent siderophore receptor n=1 Tax=Variovorax fucosicus TaxID=3053517 RepID=UPI00257921CD|nr:MULTISPECIES: TonB-dependent siderophore receptor [unclassified Variovorax]MDM0037579.1 TonB-dependent siderophore receptor [Variovorax sp. J22R193]MDM0062355.1 TonB-dependent siderophore receptor [Variovorax sp. J22G21]